MYFLFKDFSACLPRNWACAADAGPLFGGYARHVTGPSSHIDHSRDRKKTVHKGSRINNLSWEGRFAPARSVATWQSLLSYHVVTTHVVSNSCQHMGKSLQVIKFYPYDHTINKIDKTKPMDKELFAIRRIDFFFKCICSWLFFTFFFGVHYFLPVIRELIYN